VRSRACTIRASANLRRNLDRIGEFLQTAQAPLEFNMLVARLSDEVIPALERFPEIGADFLARAPLSDEGKALFARVVALLGDSATVRQLVMGDYVLLYAVRRDTVYLLAIRHHRELSFDFALHWP